MEINLLNAIKNIVQTPNSEIKKIFKSKNRVNSVGESFEGYIKDVFSNSSHVEDENEKLKLYNKCFSYLGNQNNPPDLIIKGGDAIEIKKIQSNSASIALNSSYPKSRLYANSPMITKECKNCENWIEKDLLYVIGSVEDSAIKTVWFLYGDCYAAEKETYERIKDKISKSLIDLSDIEISETKEIGRINKVDPLGITNLRIRGMWHIEHPNKVFRYLMQKDQANFVLNALILESKYLAFSETDRKIFENIQSKNFSIKNVKIKSPDNPAKLLDARLINFSI
jgi:hypothetical protein